MLWPRRISALSGHAQIGSPEIWNLDLQQVLLQVDAVSIRWFWRLDSGWTDAILAIQEMLLWWDEGIRRGLIYFWLDSCDLHVQSSYLSFVRFNVICGNRCFFMFLLLSWPLTSPNTLHLGPLFENLLQVCYKSAQVETSWKEDFATRLQNGGCELQLC